ncbi:hypothetical protein [Syntrophomonas palmitatica]|uniref:hypothetical protein n=1 Tax=Syntrophomonas palmitatica TaxID=402877 RepID=UPI000AA3259A|nr:hypothetical protein [Syntrophomonas palmitatica]
MSNRKKFKLINVWYPQDLTLTEAREYITQKDLSSLEVGNTIEYRGIGHPVRFTIVRIK